MSSAVPVSRETAGPASRLIERAGALGVDLAPDAAAALVALLDRIAIEPQNLTTIEGLEEGIERHLLDSLVALTLPEVAAAASRSSVTPSARARSISRGAGPAVSRETGGAGVTPPARR